MKNYLILVLVFLASTVQAQRWGRELGLNYVNADPTGGMGRVIDRAHGATLNLGLVTPEKRFAMGLDLGFAQYGSDKSRQEYTLDDGSTADMDIIVSNMFGTLTGYGRWYFMTTGAFRPYLTARAGYAWYDTNLNIYDPDDNDHCEPVDSDVLHHDGTIIGSMGVGMKFDLSKIFGRMEEQKFFLEANYNFSQGGYVQYMNADANHQQAHTTTHDHVMAEFINTQTQVVHEHHVGNLYRNPVQMRELRVGFAIQLQR
jgi:hypothetical protein